MFRAGETFPHDPAISEAEAQLAWVEQSQAGRRLGFRAMQFNLVVSTNTAGIRCWQRNGFQVVGTLPGAFRHRQLGYVDALVMLQGLVEGPKP